MTSRARGPAEMSISSYRRAIGFAMRTARRFPAATFAISICVSLTSGSATAAEEKLVEVPTRPGVAVRVLLARPANPAGSVILLAGGHGNLDLGPTGAIGWGKGNQLVRTREAYARAGFVTAVPDVAPDMKDGKGAVSRYRWSENHARDIGALVAYLRAITAPVYLVGTSRGALSASNAVVRLSGPERPDAAVITAGMLVHVNDKQPSVERTVGGLDRIGIPILLVQHEHDECAYTPASGIALFKPLLTAAPRVDVVMMRGGSGGRGDPCEAHSHHGFLGLDDEVVAAVTGWLKKLADRAAAPR